MSTYIHTLAFSHSHTHTHMIFLNTQGAKMGATRAGGVTVQDLALAASSEIRAALRLKP